MESNKLSINEIKIIVQHCTKQFAHFIYNG